MIIIRCDAEIKKLDNEKAESEASFQALLKLLGEPAKTKAEELFGHYASYCDSYYDRYYNRYYDGHYNSYCDSSYDRYYNIY